VRAFVWRLSLGAHQDDLAVETRISEAGGDRVTGRTAAGDQRSGRVFSSWRRRRSDQKRYPPRTTTANAYAMSR
jgi:hypothetical protein